MGVVGGPSRRVGGECERGSSGALKTPKSLHKLRDGVALAEMTSTLSKCGYEHGDILLNFPDSNSAGPRSYADLIVMTTRPPLDDKDQDIRRPISRSYNRLEVEIVGAGERADGKESEMTGLLRPFFEVCSRSHVQLPQRLARRLPKAKANRRDIQFYVQSHHWAWYHALSYRPIPKDDRRTAAYLIYVPSMPRVAEGRSLFVTFGMGGNDTLLWCRLLRKHRELHGLVSRILVAGKPWFVMAELVPKKEFPEDNDLWVFQDFGKIAEAWDVEIVLDCEGASS